MSFKRKMTLGGYTQVKNDQIFTISDISRRCPQERLYAKTFLLNLPPFMTFLNPIFLWASAAVAIPIIVHLFNFRRPKKVLFSDISMVREVKRSVVKRLRLKQWLLLASRILAILALVFMFARPVWQNESAGGMVTGNSSVAIVIDNSYSMKAGNDKGSYWLQAQKLAGEILKSYTRNDEFLIMSSADLRINYNFSDQEAAVKELKKFQVRQNSLSLDELLSFGGEIFSRSGNPNKILYFLSDFQQSTVVPDSSLAGVPEGVYVKLVPLTTRKLKNAFVADNEVASRIIEKGRPVDMKLTVVNDANDPAKNLGLRAQIDKQSRPLATEDLEANGTKEVEFNLTPQKSGWQAGFIEIDDYPVEFDNRRFFSYYVPEKEKMLIVEEASSPHLRLIFSGGVLDQFDVTFASFRELSSVDLTPFKSIILVGLREISSGMQEKLTAHLKEGKSIMYFPGANINKSNINTFLSGLNIGVFGDELATETGQYASGVDLEHPVFDGVFVSEEQNRKFDAPKVYRHYSFTPVNAIVQNQILKLQNQDPVLVESQPEGGLFYTFTFFPSESWTDFTIRSSGFAILIQLARIMNQTKVVQQNQELGNYTFKRLKTKEKEQIRLVDKDGKEFFPAQNPDGGYMVLSFRNMEDIGLKEGNYDIMQGDKLLERISFNVPDSESRLAALNQNEMETFVKDRGLERTEVAPGVPGTFAAAIEYQKAGFPLWKYFLLLGLLFFLAEFLILQIKEKA